MLKILDNSAAKLIIALSLFISFSASLNQQAAIAKPSTKTKPEQSTSTSPLKPETPQMEVEEKPVTLTGGIDVLSTACNAAGFSLQSESLPTTVLQVRAGSSAFNAGLQKNDRVLQGDINQNTITLKIERAGKTYALNVQYRQSNLQGETVATDKRVVEQAQADWNMLKNFDTFVLLDCSASMGMPLAGGPMMNFDQVVHPDQQSIWTWTYRELYQFAKESESFSGSFMFCPFSDKYRIYPNCTADTITHQTDNFKFGGLTNLDSPLTEILNHHTSSRSEKPLLVVVVSDGILCDCDIEGVLSKFVRSLNSQKQARILFLQIGANPIGAEIVTMLDNNLIEIGAPFDIVSSITSSQLKRVGLRHGLILALGKPLEPNAKYQNLAAAGAIVRERLAKIRKQASGN